MFRRGFKMIICSPDVHGNRTLYLFAPFHQKSQVLDACALDTRGQKVQECRDSSVVSFDVNDYKTAFRNKKLSEVVRALLLFKLCTYDVMIKNSLTVRFIHVVYLLT